MSGRPEPTAGYSGTPLARKLGMRAAQRVAFVQAPVDFDGWLGPLPSGVRRCGPEDAELDLIVFFADSRVDLKARFGPLAQRLQAAGALWVAWPKRASGVATDLIENVVRAIGLEGGLVDNKVCAISDVWSGLRFVYRLADRPEGKRSGKVSSS